METYFGDINTSQDAIKLFEACRLGLLPQTQHRLSLSERRRIRPDSVFVWNDRNGHLRRWTDSRAWGPCRIDGRFVSYQEMAGRFCKQKLNQEGASTYWFKSNGMVKRTFTSKTSNGTRFHLVAYSSPQHSQVSKLSRPTEDHQLSKIRPAEETYREPRPNPRQERPSSKSSNSSIQSSSNSPIHSSSNSSIQSPSKRLPTLKAILTQTPLDQMLDLPERRGKITRHTLNPIINLPNNRSSSPGTAFASASKP